MGLHGFKLELLKLVLVFIGGKVANFLQNDQNERTKKILLMIELVVLNQAFDKVDALTAN